VERKKDLIIRGGFNIYPRDIEEVLHGHPAVRDAVAVGKPDPVVGEEAVVYVELRRASPPRRKASSGIAGTISPRTSGPSA
jgi:long-chain acyl-CoA synthetase